MLQTEVIEDGQPHSGLLADDFVVRDKGKQVPVVDAVEVDLCALDENLPKGAYRQLFLLFDLEFSDPRLVVQATELAQGLTSPERLATTRVSIATHEPASGLRIESELTDDRDGLIEILDTLHEESAGRFASSVAAAGPVVKGDDLITSRARNTESAKGIVQREQGRILGLIQSLARLETLTRSVPGSAQVLLFSPGFDSSVILGNDATQRLDASWSAEQSEAAAQGDVWAVTEVNRSSGGLVETALFEMLSDYARAGVPIQAVSLESEGSTRPVKLGAQGPNGLTIMADKTGGQLFRGRGAQLLEEIRALEPTGSIYLLTFEPRSLDSGRYRKLDVRLKSPTKTVKVIAPPGYFVP